MSNRLSPNDSKLPVDTVSPAWALPGVRVTRTMQFLLILRGATTHIQLQKPTIAFPDRKRRGISKYLEFLNPSQLAIGSDILKPTRNQEYEI